MEDNYALAIPELILSMEELSYTYEQAKKDYPYLHKAWRSMCANNPADSITPMWRGREGFINFIEDTSKLPNAPSMEVKSKLKRKDTRLQFSLANIYWSIPKNIARIQSSAPPIKLDIEELKQKYTTKEEKEERINLLFHLSIGDTLTPSEELELQILTDSLITGEINVPIQETLTKYTDI